MLGSIGRAWRFTAPPASISRTAVVKVLLLACCASLLALSSAQAQRSVSITGQVMLMHGDDVGHHREVDAGVFLKVGNHYVRLPENAERYAGKRATAHGFMRQGRFVTTQLAASGGSTTTLSSASTSGASAIGAKRVAVILFNFSDDTSQPFTPTSVAQTYFATGAADRSVANYYDEVSWGQIRLTGQAFGWLTISASSKAGCDPGTWAAQADAAATAQGLDLAAFDYKTYVYPGVPSCGWGGLAQMPGNENWINGTPDVGLMAHELGHNFGLNHATSARCTLPNGDAVAFSQTCSTVEYGDPYVVMGSAGAAQHISDWHLGLLGLTSDIQVVSTDGTYSLSPVELLSGSPHALRIPRGDGTYFDLEYRQPYGLFDAFQPNSPAVTGVMVRYVGAYSVGNKPELIDSTPETPTLADAPVGVGRVFADPTTGIRVTTVSAGPSGAQVQIQVRPGGDFTPPNVHIANPADGGALTLPGTVTVAATDNVAISKVELYRDGSLYATSRSAPYLFTWVDGPSHQYRLQAVAYDTSGISSVSPAVTVNATQSDTSAPTDPPSFRSIANGQTSVATAWTPSSDNVGVDHYELTLGGADLSITTGTSFTFAGLTCGSGYVLTIAAVDSAGNVSPGVGLSAWTTACTGDSQAPTMPLVVQANASSANTVGITWQASSDNVAVAGYRVDRNGVSVGRTNSTSFTDSGVAAGKTYTYTVTAYDAVWNMSGTSDPVSVSTPAGDFAPPSQPTGLVPTSITGSSISLSWQAATDNVAVAGYRVYRGGLQIGQTAGTSWTDAGLVSGIEYGYTVAAYDGSGNLSAQSSVALATTLAADTVAPTAPANLTASGMKGRKVNLKWAAASDNVGVAGYRVFRDGSLLATVTGSLTFTDSPSRGNHSYCVRAIDAASNVSAASNSVSVRV